MSVGAHAPRGHHRALSSRRRRGGGADVVTFLIMGKRIARDGGIEEVRAAWEDFGTLKLEAFLARGLGRLAGGCHTT